MSTLLLAAVLSLQGQQTIQIQVPAPQYQIQIQQVPQYQYRYVAPQPRVNYLTPLQPGDVLIPQRTGLFGWRTTYKLYRRR